jgi:hypothetical protein
LRIFFEKKDEAFIRKKKIPKFALANLKKYSGDAYLHPRYFV